MSEMLANDAKYSQSVVSVTHSGHNSPVDASTQENEPKMSVTDDIDGKGKIFSVDDTELSPGYYRSSYFLGSMFAVCLSMASGVAGFGLIAPLLGYINADIGPSPDLVWVALTYTLTGAVGFMLVGRLTDIFGRRWFFIGGSCIALLGSVIGATAQNIHTMIAAETFIGLGASAQMSYYYSLGELVPVKHRFYANGICYLFNIPLTGLGAIVSYSFVLQTSAGWRGAFYLLIALNALSTLCWFLFYHPPTFSMKHGSRKRMDYVWGFDFVGLFLATSGILLFLMGISWGGVLYPWKSAHVISATVIGGVLLVAFFIYEIYVPLKEPLLPKNLMTNRDWLVTVMIWSLGSSIYYGFALVWPQMVATLYANGRLMWSGWAASVLGGGFVLGECLGGLAKGWRNKYQIIVVFTLGSILLACVAVSTPDNPNTAIALLTVGSVLIGYNECVTAVVATICIDDQREIGTALGIGGSIRSFVSTVASSVYSAVLSNKLSQEIPARVPSALVSAGLPTSSVPAFLNAMAIGTEAAFAAVEGLTPSILKIGTRAYQDASSIAYRYVFLTTIAFSGIGIILTFFVPNIDHLMTSEVVVQLHERANEEVVGTKKAAQVQEKAMV